jgi:2,5-diketo-D-gluconate reductase A
MTTVPTLPLLSGHSMPRIGLGTWPMRDDALIVLPKAVELGYRMFDTAYMYKNEADVGRALAASGVEREELFITTKLNAEWHGVDLVREAFAGSAERLGVEYIDLFLIHWPNPDRDQYVDAWRGLVQLREEGLVRSIGVSNFKPAHIDRVIEATGIAPDVNQIQLNPWLTRDALRTYDRAHGIVTESWGPLGQGRGLLEEPLIGEVAERYGRTPAQVVLRWHMELGLTTVPKSSSVERMAENIAIFDFQLDSADVALLSSLDRGEAAAVDSDVFGH